MVIIYMLHVLYILIVNLMILHNFCKSLSFHSVTCKDVVMGRGSGTQNHCGNVTYRKVVFLCKVREPLCLGLVYC